MAEEAAAPNGPADGFRTLEQLGLPDCRMGLVVVPDGGSFRPFARQDRWAAIEPLELNGAVPEEIRVHYDTARNLYLHAWHVYRFHAVAEQQVLTTLEMALRKALIERNLLDAEGRQPPESAAKKRPPPRPMLLQLLRIARDRGIIRNEGFTRRQKWAERTADLRRSIEQVEFMSRNNITEMAAPTEPAVPTQEELEYDWLADFVEFIRGCAMTTRMGAGRCAPRCCGPLKRSATW